MSVAAEYLKAKGAFNPQSDFAQFDPTPFVFVSLVAVFGKRRLKAYVKAYGIAGTLRQKCLPHYGVLGVKDSNRKVSVFGV